MGRRDGLHRAIGGHCAGGRPGVLEEEFPEVVRGDACGGTTGGSRKPPGHHPLFRTGKRKKHMDKKAVTT